MNCRFYYCLYNEANQCKLSEIEINELGICETCIEVSIPEQQLQALKQQQLTKKAALDL